MKATQQLHDLGQSLWLDNITRRLLDNGTLDATSTTFGHRTDVEPDHLRSRDRRKGTPTTTTWGGCCRAGKSTEDAVLRAGHRGLAPRRGPVRSRFTNAPATVDGWVSLEVSPLLAYDAEDDGGGRQEAAQQAARPNLFIKIPGTRKACPPSRRLFSPACRSM